MSKSIKSISPVPIDSKFYGEKESDNQIIDLYRKIMIFDQNSTENRGPTEACLGSLARIIFYFSSESVPSVDQRKGIVQCLTKPDT